MNRFVLYIDDNPDQLEMVQHLIERRLPSVVVEVCCTINGAELFLNKHCYDLVICDVMLPGELGTAIAEKILQRDPTQPIYLISDYVSPMIREEAERIGLKLQPKVSTKRPDEFLQDVQQLLEVRPCAAARQTSSNTISDAAAGNSATFAAASSSRFPSEPLCLISPHVRAARAASSRRVA